MTQLTGSSYSSKRYAESFLNSLSDYEKTTGYSYSAAYFNLKRMEHLLFLLGHPEHKVPSVHITGTKGKGSTANYIAAILSGAGFSTGLYTSPHILSFRERIKLNGIMISWKELAGLTKIIKPAVELLNKETKFGMPTFFEVYTALGFLYFARKKAGVMVLEVGMGGRLDATNVVNPLVSVITNISLDHIKELGNTLAKIAKEKAGIIKPGVPVVSAVQKREVLSVLKSAAAAAGSRLKIEGRDFKHTVITQNKEGSLFSFRSQELNLNNLKLRMRGKHQAANAALAIASSQIAAVGLGKRLDRLKRAIPCALNNLQVPGRLQLISKKPLILLDAAHNAASAKVLLAGLKLFKYGKLVMVVGMSANKDNKGFLKVFEKEAALAVFVRSSNYRSADPKILFGSSAALAKKAKTFESVSDGIKYALMQAGKNDLICVTGSFYVLHDTFKYLKLKA